MPWETLTHAPIFGRREWLERFAIESGIQADSCSVDLVVEQALHERSNMFSMLVEGMNEGLGVIDEHGLVTYVNERMANMLDYTRDEMIGRPALDYFERCAGREWQQQAYNSGSGPEKPFETLLLSRGGREIHARVSPRKIFAADGSFKGSFAIVMDITERVKAERLMRESESERRLLAAQLLATQELERKRIAADLHDVIGQSLSAIKFSVELSLEQLAEQGPEVAAASLQALIPKIRHALEEVHQIAMDLHPRMLEDLGLLATLSWFFREYQAIYHTITINKDIDLRESDVPAGLKTIIFRILQEAMNNIANHARCDQVHFTLKKVGHTLQLAVADNGQGFDPAARKERDRGMGLAGMKDRALFSGGSCRIDSAPGQGVRIQASWPCH